jgi:hypothetical protein
MVRERGCAGAEHPRDGDVLRRWLEVVDVTTGFEDFDDLDIRAANLSRQISHDGMQRSEFERSGLSEGERQCKSCEDGFHGGGCELE